MPSGWLDDFAWKIDLGRVEALAAASASGVTFLCGGAENESDVWRHFELVVCLVIDDETLRHRLTTRTTNEFGKHSEELAAALAWNRSETRRYRERGASLVDATRPLAEVVHEVLVMALAGSHWPDALASANLVRVQVERFRERHLDGAATLLAESLGMHGRDTGLRPTRSEAASARTVIGEAMQTGPAVVALDDGDVVGFMIAPLPRVPGTGASRTKVVHHAAWPPVARDAYRRMYEEIAGALVAAGCFEHSVPVLIDQQTVLMALFELQFGIDQIKGTKTLPSILDARLSDTIRTAHPGDIDRLVELCIELTQFHSRSPMLAPTLFDVPRARTELAQHISADDNIVLVACDGDAIVGMIQAQPDSLYADTTTIGMNIVTEHARSAGVGTTMLNALCASAASSGAERCAVGWDSANLLSDAFYRARGFTPVRYDLRRLIDPRVAWANDNLDYRQFKAQPQAP